MITASKRNHHITTSPHRQIDHRRGSVIALVLWAIAIAATVGGTVQLLAYRQATLGREALARVQARWAARAGVEQSIAIMAYHTEFPNPLDAKGLIRDLEDYSYFEFADASYDIRHTIDGVEYAGPMDEHSKLNINTATRDQLLNLRDFSFDIADATRDWIDEDDNVSLAGAEEQYYLSLSNPYEPRNGPMRSTAELELVAGSWRDLVRGEDANLNNRLDPNEDDGSLSDPPDDDDGVLDGGWASQLTAYSRQGGVGAASGKPRIDLSEAETEEIMTRLNVSAEQAEALQSFAGRPNASMEMLLITPLSRFAAAGGGGNAGLGDRLGGSGDSSGVQESDSMEQAMNDLLGQGEDEDGGGGGGGSNGAVDLDAFQLRAVLDEATLDGSKQAEPGKLNINTVSRELMEDVLLLDTSLVDEIINQRSTRSEGIASLLDLQQLDDVDSQNLSRLVELFTTKSNVYSITSRGKSFSTGLEVEIFVVVDRSTLPIRILEYREQ